MITRITKENRAKYVKLFAKATEALKEGYESYANDEEFSISSLEEYFQEIEELMDLDPLFVRLPLDEEMFEIDLNTRQITIPSNFKKSGVAVQGDDLAEIVYFRTDRYFDATDLSQTCIMIQWEAPNGNKMVSPAYLPEVDSETDKLIFGWAITREMTSLPGNLKFSVAFVAGEVISEDEEVIDIANLEYRLGTLTTTVLVNSGLTLAQQGKIKYENRLVDLKNRIKNTPVLGGIIDGLADLAEILEYFGYDWKEEKEIENIFEELMDDPGTDEKETGLPLIAVSPKAGLISYEMYKEGVQDPIVQGPGAIRYIQVDYSAPIADRAYFIKEGEQNYRAFRDGVDSWMVYGADGKESVNPLLFEKIAFLPIDGPGVYYAKIKNKQGRNRSVLDTRSYVSDGVECKGIVTVPGPTEIEKVSISTLSDILPVGESVLIASDVEFVDTDKTHASLKYQWYKKVDEELFKIEGADKESYETFEIGDYVLKVQNHWNKAVSAEVVSENVIKVYLSAEEPEITEFFPEVVEGTSLDGAQIAHVGTKLIVKYNPINQEQAKQYVRWMHSDVDGDINLEDWAFVMVKDEEGNDTAEFVEGAEFIPEIPGDYKAIVYNFITENNQKSTATDKDLGESWAGKIIRVLAKAN